MPENQSNQTVSHYKHTKDYQIMPDGEWFCKCGDSVLTVFICELCKIKVKPENLIEMENGFVHDVCLITFRRQSNA